ncbi:DUF4124 domain-containing protein [Ideonella sp. BN130291]|uniref:DUF4124 domain-containing protein n=1 Tax=Ideonella sp. BN130291 TaxID=3112940 RepID=UPI002E2731EE|nr:DUF4124 domain-containing protein [Ideonella sp. BN130291]
MVVAGLLATSFSVAAHAQWKWRDKSGQMHLSDLPPPADVAEKDVLQRPDTAKFKAAPAPSPASASVAASAPRAAVDPELEARMKRTEQERTAQQKKEEERVAAVKAENCARAKEHLRSLDSGIRLSRVNEKGEREILDDKQRAEEAQRSRNVVASECR